MHEKYKTEFCTAVRLYACTAVRPPVDMQVENPTAVSLNSIKILVRAVALDIVYTACVLR